MIQMVIIGLAILSTLAGVVTIVKGEISLNSSSKVEGPAARGIAIGLFVLAAGMAIFALVILPGIGRHR